MENRVSAEAVIGQYEQELAQMTRRAIIAEAHGAALAEENEQLRKMLPKDRETGPEEGV